TVRIPLLPRVGWIDLDGVKGGAQYGTPLRDVHALPSLVHLLQGPDEAAEHVPSMISYRTWRTLPSSGSGRPTAVYGSGRPRGDAKRGALRAVSRRPGRTAGVSARWRRGDRRSGSGDPTTGSPVLLRPHPLPGTHIRRADHCADFAVCSSQPAGTPDAGGDRAGVGRPRRRTAGPESRIAGEPQYALAAAPGAARTT